MSALFAEPPRLSLAQKFSRLSLRMRDPEWRRYGRNLLIGRMLGLAVLPLAILALHSLVTIATAYADDPAAASPVMPADLIDMAKNPVINPLNTAWVLLGGVPRVRHAGGLHDARGRLLPEPRDRQRARRVRVRHLRLRPPALGVGLCLHVRRGQRASSAGTCPAIPPRASSSCRTSDLLDGLRRTAASRSSRTTSSSSRSPTAPRRSARARWSAGPGSSATSSTPSACRASSTRSSATGAGAPTASSPRWARRTTSSRTWG